MQNSSKGNNSWKNHRTRTRRWYAHPPSILNIPMKFQWNPTSSFREFAWTRTVPYIFMQNSSKGNNSWKNHRTRTRRWYAHPPLILNIPMKFHWNPTSSFREFAWTRAGRTHGRTDARTKRRLYAPPKFFGEHNKGESMYFQWRQLCQNCFCLLRNKSSPFRVDSLSEESKCAVKRTQLLKLSSSSEMAENLHSTRIPLKTWTSFCGHSF